MKKITDQQVKNIIEMIGCNGVLAKYNHKGIRY